MLHRLPPRSLPLCCCRLTPFGVALALLVALGLALLVPGVLMRLESVPVPTPLALINLCRQPAPWAAGALEEFRRQVSSGGGGRSADDSGGEDEAPYQGTRLSTSALSVYRGSSSYRCAEESAYEGSPQTLPLPDTLLLTGIKYVPFLTLPEYVGQLSTCSTHSRYAVLS